jgi:arylsulfatase A-like enzyme
VAGHEGAATLVLARRGYEKVEGEPAHAYWGSPVLTRPDRKRPLVIVYLVDTLRADHTTPYGYERDTTPALARFAKDAVVFESAISAASWTKPSVGSVFTSLLPSQHGAVQLRDPLHTNQFTMAELFKAKGYVTGAAIANSVIYGPATNFEQGFDFFAGLHGPDDRPSKLVEAAGVVDAGLSWLDARKGLPTLLYMHTMDPHVPYQPPPPFDRKYEPHPLPPTHPATDPRTDYVEPLDRERMITQYDGDIAYGDREFGRFLQELKTRGLYERALIVFVADHGEEFLDHGQFLHGKSVFDELIHVPLVVKFPGGRDAGRRVKQQVQVVDVLPTVLQSQDLPVPEPPHIAGRPLQALLAGAAPEPPAVSEISHRGFVAHGMRTSRDKYVRRFSPDDDELYFDLVRDPGEKDNRVADAGRRVELLKKGVEAAMVPNPYRHHVRAAGGGEFVLRLRTGGWFEGVEPTGLTAADYQVEGNGRKLALRLRPRPGTPREVAFSIRPQGAPVWLEGTRDGRPLRPSDVLIAQEGVPALSLPLQLPEIETEKERTENIFAAPPAERAGLHVWLTLVPGREIMGAFTKDARERLCALGYLDCR